MKIRRILGPVLAIFTVVSLSSTPQSSAHFAAAAPVQQSAATAAHAAHAVTQRAPAADTRVAQQSAPKPQATYEPQPVDAGVALRTKHRPLDTAGAVAPNVTAQAEYGVGDVRQYVVLNDITNRYQLTNYVVRYKSGAVEVWVQQDLSYRNSDGTLNPIHPDSQDPLKVTQAKVDELAAAAEKIIPTDVEYFGDYDNRDGSTGILLGALGLPADYYAGPPQSVVIVISNVRDANYYDPINNPSYIAGFYSPDTNGFIDRNVITLDSKRFDVNTGAPVFQNEATIAHEFQHLINGDYDDDEESWANEGRSEFAEFINGYRGTPEDHRTQWSDYPENSLTLWGDQDADPDQTYEILADYQEAYWFQLYLAGRLREAGIGTADNQYIKDVSQLTIDSKNGIESINAMLTAVGAPFDFNAVWSDYRSAMLFGGTSDQTTWGSYISQWQGQSGVAVAPLDIGRMRRNLNFEGYDTPGAPPYGSDYIELGWSEAITAGTTLNFNGSASIPTQWSVVTLQSTGVLTEASGANPAGNVLYSGHSDFSDRFMILPVTVPGSGNRNLAFDTMYNIEQDWDYGIVQVSTDNGASFTTLPIAGTTATPQTDVPQIIDALPGFTGVSGSDTNPSWLHKTYDLSAYSGQSILLAFRYSADQASSGTIPPPPAPGWYIDNLSVGSTALYTNEASVPAAAKSVFELRNLINTFTVDIVSFADKNGAAIAGVTSVPLDGNGDGTFNLGSLLSQAGFNEAGERVVVLVSVIPPTASPDLVSAPNAYADYTLTGLPPSIYTSRARAVGTASNTSLIRPRVFPGDDFTLNVTVDNLGRNADLDTSAASPAYVAMALPPNTTVLTGTFTSDVSPGNLQLVPDLSTLGGGLPAGPGVYWNGTVDKTADLSFALKVAEPLAIGTLITPTVEFANAPFNANPSQRFTDLQAPVQVVSPLALSTGTAAQEARLGSTAVFTYTLINTDDVARNVDFEFTVPDGTTLQRLSISQQDPNNLGAQAASTIRLGITVPPYEPSETVTVVRIELKVGLDYKGLTLDPMVTLFQPGSDIPYNAIPLTNPGGASVITGRIRLPLVVNNPSPGVGQTRVPLSSANEVPAVTATAYGTFAYTYDPATRVLSYTLSAENTTSAITMAHIHRGTPGVAGPVLYPLYAGGGTFGPGFPLSGTVTLSEADAALLAAHGLYVNVHTVNNPSGELRGNL